MDEASFLALSPLGSSLCLFDNGHSHLADSAMVSEGNMLGHRDTTSLVSCVVTNTLHRTEMLAEPVREPATSFANVHSMTAMTCVNMDSTGRSAVKPILQGRTPLPVEGIPTVFSVKLQLRHLGSTARKLSGCC